MKTAHQLARELLAGPDLPVFVPTDPEEYCECQIASINQVQVRMMLGMFQSDPDPDDYIWYKSLPTDADKAAKCFEAILL